MQTRRLFFKLSFGYLAGLILSCFSPAVRGALSTTARGSNSRATIAFGSCNHTHLPQPMWSHIQWHQPDLFLWLGDAVYADTDDPVEMRRQYQTQYAHPEYQKVRKNMPVLGVWDDHDFGGNNLGRDNPIKVQGQQMFLDFLDEPLNTQRRRQQGIYTTYTYGSGDQQVKIFLLDTRYHRERSGKGRASLLGKDQWRWLEAELQQTTARVNLIASGSSVLSTQVPGGEEWEDFRWAKKRLFHLLNKHRVEGVLFLTGDRHFAAYMTERISGRTYHEFMCSGLTHYVTRWNVTLLMKTILGKSNTYFGTNFGLLNFDWGQSVAANFEVYDKDNRKRLDKRLHLLDGYWVNL